MEIWKDITKKTREFIGYKCDACTKELDTAPITVEFGYGHSLDGTTYHFCNFQCLLQFIIAELKKENK